MAIRILLADDHALVRGGIRKILEEADGLEVVAEAADGREAVQLATQLRPDVVLMDIAMPEMNGIEATRAIKDTLSGTAVIALSAYDDDPYVFALLEAGVAGYVLKGCLPHEIVVAIRQVYEGESVLASSITRKLIDRATSSARGMEPPPLSGREMEVLRLAATGFSTVSMARALGVSSRTVQLHFREIFDKLGVDSRTEAVVTALRRGWLCLDELNEVE